MQGRHVHRWYGDVIDGDPALARRVKAEIRERGALASRDFEGENPKGMWNWKPAKRMLEALWSAGELAIDGRRDFQRLYDLPERVIPRAVLDAPMPDEEDVPARADPSGRAVARRAHRLGHRRALAAHDGLRRIRPLLTALVEEGELRAPRGRGRRRAVLRPRAARRSTSGPSAAPCFSRPFDNLLWDRPFAEPLLRLPTT